MRSALALLCAAALVACGPGDESDDVLDVTEDTEDPTGKTDAAAGSVELKVTLPPAQVPAAITKFKLADAKATRRDVWFYDTPALELFGKGVILRARKTKDGADDSTVKRRPLTAADISRDWLGLAGFKCEEDRVGTKSAPSCSFTTRQDDGEIDEVASGDRALDKLFSADQERWLSTGTTLRWSRWKALGPVKAKVWKLSVRGFKPPITAEHWSLPDGTVLLELSTKVTASVADQAGRDFEALLKARGFDTRGNQETKTRVALEYFTAH
jgi:hypothetical protein